MYQNEDNSRSDVRLELSSFRYIYDHERNIPTRFRENLPNNSEDDSTEEDFSKDMGTFLSSIVKIAIPPF